MTILEAKVLYDLAKKNVGLGVIVEVGSALGGSACLFSHASKEINGEKTYCIDSWQNSYWAGRTTRQGGKLFGVHAAAPIGQPFQSFLANVKENGVPALVEAIRGESQVVAKNWGKPIKLLFIDGSHDYEDVVTDIKSWEPHVVKNGIIAFHDYTDTAMGVNKAVNELISPSENFSKLEEVDSLIVFTKTGCQSPTQARRLPV